MYKQGHQQKWFFPCKHIFVKLKEEDNLMYIINMCKQGHQQKCFFPLKTCHRKVFSIIKNMNHRQQYSPKEYNIHMQI